MSNFKSGSGNLDFGGSDKEDAKPEPTPTEETPQTGTESDKGDEANSSDQPIADAPTTSSNADKEPTAESTTDSASTKQYPYFIRRSNVGDERETRLEIHVRDKVADSEAAFRNELAKQLDTNEVSKTDAREFALLAAFQQPERVAELMEQEGFGTL